MTLTLSGSARSIALIGLMAFVANQVLNVLVILGHGESTHVLCQFDCLWYASIVENGYMPEPVGYPRGDAANWAFFPLFPLLSMGVQWVTGLAGTVSNIIVAKLLLLPAIWAFLAFQRMYRPEIPLWIGAILIALNPFSIYANTGYTETLFILLTCLSLIAIRCDRPVLAGAMGALLAATRVVGVGIGLPFAVYALRKVRRESNANGGKLIFAGLLIPLGLASYMFYLHAHIGDAMAFSHVQRAWDREIGNPVVILLTAFTSGNWYNQTMAGFAVFSLMMTGYLVAQKEPELAIFLAFATIIPLATGTDSLGRYVMLQPSLLLAVGLLISKRRGLYPLLAVSVFGYIAMCYAWLEELSFVI